MLACWRAGAALLPLEAGTPAPALPAACADLPPEIIHLKRTSGSTGEPKLVLFDAAALTADCDQLVTAMGLTPGRPNLAFISPAHSYGFSNLVLPLLLHGIPLILGGAPFPAALDQGLADHGPCCVPAVPALWQVWLAADLDLSRIGLAISAGAPLPLELERQAFERHGLRIHNFFGSSECGGIAYDPNPLPRTDPRQLGRPLPAVGLARDPQGRLVVRGPTVARGYLPPDPALPGDGSFITSDLVDFSADGSLLHLGRESEALALAGRRASPDEIETMLRPAAPAGVSLLVLGLPSRNPARETDIVLLYGGSDRELAAALRRHAAAALPAWQQPRRLIHCPGLAPDARGKLSRARWREWLLARRG